MDMETELTDCDIMIKLFTELQHDLNSLKTLGKQVNNLNINENEKMELRKVYAEILTKIKN
jgi:ribosomal 50S subunit-associated protein YjgA (DUF615 family)